MRKGYVRVILLSLAALGVAHGADSDPVTPPRVGAGTEYDNVQLPQVVDTTAQVLPATVAIDPAVTIKPVSTDLLGITLAGRQCDDQFMGGTGTTVTDEMRALLPRLPLHLVRISQYNNALGHEVAWKQAIGPHAGRPSVRFSSWDRPQPNHAGPVELIAAIRAAHAQARFVWTVDIENPDPDDAADLAEYLTGDGTSNPRGGIDWAARRRADGLAEPAPIVLWELGNETDWRNPGQRLTAEVYIERCRHAIAAIRSVQPTARFAAHAATAPWGWKDRFKEDWQSWHRSVLQALAADLDHLVLHPYYLGYPTSVIETFMDAIRDDVRTITGDGRITLYISEHAQWPNAEKGQEWKTSWWQTHGLPGCLATAQFLNRIAVRPDVGPATYHCLSAGPWGLIYRGAETKRIWTTGITDLFALYAEHLGDHAVAAELMGEQADPRNPDCSLTVLATRRPDGLSVIAVNRSPAVRQLEMSIAGGGTWNLLSGAVLSGKSPDARNTEHQQGILVSRLAAQAPMPTQRDLPPRSVTALILRRP